MTVECAQNVVFFIKNTIELQNIEECFIHFHGGEPLLNYSVVKYFMDELSKIKGVKLHFSLTTNGTIYSERIFKEIICRLDEISVSIDGSEQEQNLSRILKDGRSSFDIVICNIRKLLEKGTKVTARMTVTRENVNRLYNNTIELYNNGVHHIANSIDYWNGLWSKEQLFEYHRQSLKIEEFVKLKEDLRVCGVLVTLLSCKGSCMGGISNLTIDMEGNIYPCMMVYGKKHWIIGDTMRGVKDTWKEELQQFNQNVALECQSCRYGRYCMGRRCVLFRSQSDCLEPVENICRLQKCLFDLEWHRMEENG